MEYFQKLKNKTSVRSTLKSGKDQQNVESYRPISNTSFLENRSYHIIISGGGGKRYFIEGVPQGPQGNVLGPVLFSIYTIELAWILRHHKVQFKMFADDTQLYFTINNVEDTIMPLNGFVHDSKEWMTMKKTKIK